MNLTIKNLSFERNHQFLFKNLNCELQTGEILQLRGPNGSGKSTLLRILAGYLEPLSGDILWQGKSIFDDRTLYQQQLQYLGHKNGVKPYLTVCENLELCCALGANPLDPYRIASVLRFVGLTKSMDTQAVRLSAGQVRRLALARLLINPTPLWILDEPMTALDTDGQALLSVLLKQHLSTGGLVIVATHQSLPFEWPTKVIQLGHTDFATQFAMDEKIFDNTAMRHITDPHSFPISKKPAAKKKNRVRKKVTTGENDD